MAARLSKLLRGVAEKGSVVSNMEGYVRRYAGKTWSEADEGERAERKTDHANFVRTYYDLATDFFQYGWSRSLHFAMRAPGESFEASLARHEHYLAHRLHLGPGMVAADLGCGIGGPLREIIRFTGARIVGVNNNAYQLEKARKLTDEEGLGDHAEFIECDFVDVPAPDSSFDAVFAIETTCYAPNKADVYGEAFRLLKPGGLFAAYDCILTDRFDAEDPHHRSLKAEMEVSGGLPGLALPRDVRAALEEVGFELLEARDIAEDRLFEIPWYAPLEGSGLSLATFRSSRLGRGVTHSWLWALEKLRIVPRGSVLVSSLMNRAASAYAEAGRLGIFTPMYFVLARKPG